ncbi:MarR family transcriptional regulator [Scopulibacillus darangshiensis]|uniref:MarR family transcriptional regulator n=1 Tax=Scopulibacillus darangshiensis TaxID=442528 RepID=A0A4R2NES6_9BACL|nr:MarR family transcriptional regulator [Scopulibacillus darangshiensis]TCP19747.1 MarR family transcriptional regulator [Scopulibacillus darangshiensis]
MEDRKVLLTKLEKNLLLVIRKLRRELNDVFGETITRQEFTFLKMLYQKEPQMVSSLAKELEVTASYATAVTDKLLQKGYVNRQRSAKDRRIVELSITDEGTELMNDMIKKKDAYMIESFGKLSDDEIKMMTMLIKKLR